MEYIFLKDLSILFPGPIGNPEKNILALSNISMNINMGDIVAIIGNSGAGKTTLLKTLAGNLEPDVGQIFIGGVSIYNLHSEEFNNFRYHNIFIVEQNMRDNLFYDLTSRENLEIFTMGKSTRRIKDILISLDILYLEKIQVNKLSGGEKQLVCLSLALLLNSKILILDEPTSALDNINKNKIMEKIINHCRKNDITLLFTTHDTQITKYADFVININYGRFNRVINNINHHIKDHDEGKPFQILPIDSKGAIHIPKEYLEDLNIKNTIKIILENGYLKLINNQEEK